FGEDRESCEQAKYVIWNELYDKLGELGILSVAATTNAEVNVDEEGDVPTSCSSDYLITVTNLDKGGGKRKSAGYGKESIDLAAPGTEILSTTPDHRFQSRT